jgi:hypothetical protein
MPKNLQDLTNDWLARIELNQRAHWISLERLDRMHFSIGLAAIILSTLAGATLLIGTGDVYIRSFAGLIALVSAVLVGIQTFFNHARRSGMHRAASTQLSLLRREIEGIEKLPAKYLRTQDEILINIADRLLRMEESVPQVDREIIREIRSRSQSSDLLLKRMKKK